MCVNRNFAAVLAFIVSTNILIGQTPTTTQLADGTSVRLSLGESLSSGTAQSGQVVHLEVEDDIRSGNAVVIPRGTPAEGHVVTAQPKQRMGRGGRLDLALDYVHLSDGTNLKLRASASHQGADKSGAVIAGTLLVSPLFLLMRGKDVNLPAGTAVTAFVDGGYTFSNDSRTQPANQPAAQK